MKTNLLTTIKTNKKVIIKRALIVIGAIAGATVLAKTLNSDEGLGIDLESFEEEAEVVDAEEVVEDEIEEVEEEM